MPRSTKESLYSIIGDVHVHFYIFDKAKQQRHVNQRSRTLQNILETSATTIHIPEHSSLNCKRDDHELNTKPTQQHAAFTRQQYAPLPPLLRIFLTTSSQSFF